MSNTKIFSVRLPEDQYNKLKAMAKRDVRTINSFLRFLIHQESIAQGLLDAGQENMNQEDIPVQFYSPPAYEELQES
jgi:hypothetical protein